VVTRASIAIPDPLTMLLGLGAIGVVDVAEDRGVPVVTKTSLRPLRMRNIDRSACTITVRGIPDAGKTASTSSRPISHSDWGLTAHWFGAGSAHRSWLVVVVSVRDSDRGGRSEPLRMTSNQTPSSCHSARASW